MQFEDRIHKIDNYSAKVLQKINQVSDKDADIKYNFYDPYSV